MKERLLQLISPLILFALWEIMVRTGVLDLRFFPAPSEVMERALELVRNGTIARESIVTLRRMTLGFLLAAVPGVLIGMAMGVSRTTRLLLAPLVASIYPVPKIALVPMVVILLGLGERANIAIVAISVFFMVALNTMAGVLAIDTRYFDIARDNGARGWQLIRTVALPAALPAILSGINLALGFALTVIVGTELLLPQSGLGSLIWRAYQIYDVATVFAVIVVVGLLGWLLNLLINEVERRVIPWRAGEEAARRGIRRQPTRLGHWARTWWLAVRPFSFTASTTPVTLGAVLAAFEGAWSPLLFALTLVGSVALQAGTNLINDFYDWKKGSDTAESLGPNRAFHEGRLTAREVFWGGVICFMIGSAIGLYLVGTRGTFILWLGIFAVLAGWFYTAGPAAFAYIGLGEIVVFIFMGPVMVLGSYYVLAQRIAWAPILVALPIGLLAAAILHANNMRDLDADLAAGKRTLANLFGRAASKREYLLLIGVSYALLFVLVLGGWAPWQILAALLTLPFAIELLRRATTTEAPLSLNKLVRGTAVLHERFGWLMIGGILLALLVR